MDDVFGKISHMVSDGSWMVRVQAAKTLVREQNSTQLFPSLYMVYKCHKCSVNVRTFKSETC